MTDEPDKAELENRIEKLEATIEKMMPSRRDALKMGGAALAGGSLMAGTASAGTNQRGTIGSASQPVDVESEDINNADKVTTDTIDANTADVEELTSAIGPGGRWNPIERGVNQSGTGFDVNISNIEDYDQYRLTVNETESSGDPTGVALRLNGVSTAGEYQNIFADDAGRRQEDRDNFLLFPATFSGFTWGEWVIDNFTNRAAIVGDGFARRIGQDVLVRGVVDIGGSLNTIDINSSGEQGGVVFLEGRDYV